MSYVRSVAFWFLWLSGHMSICLNEADMLPLVCLFGRVCFAAFATFTWISYFCTKTSIDSYGLFFLLFAFWLSCLHVLIVACTLKLHLGLQNIMVLNFPLIVFQQRLSFGRVCLCCDHLRYQCFWRPCRIRCSCTYEYYQHMILHVCVNYSCN